MSSDVYVQLIGAGAPQLPASYKYEITVDPYSTSYATVQIISSGRFRTKVHGDYCDVASTVKDLARLCRLAYEDAGLPLMPEHPLANFVGVHP